MSQFNAQQLTIDEVIKSNFIFEIPAYQRGYRWEKTEVVDLLDDIMDIVRGDKTINEVKNMCDAYPYCLQPIAFDTKNESEGKMVVVDGQQRLTTLLLVLKYIEERIQAVPATILPMLGITDVSEYCRCYELKYDNPTRDKIFYQVKQDLNQTNTENIDSYYITKAYQRIKKWGDEKIGDNVLNLISFAIKVIYGTSVIWYEIDQTTDGSSNDYFAKTNTGKIPLTNSELIKANLMLDEYCIKKIDESKFQGGTEEETRKLIANQKDFAKVRLQNERIKMSRQWDEIESNLRSDEFWYFLAEESDKYEDTRIDFIFDIVAKKIYPEIAFSNMSYDEFMSFNKERGAFTIIARYLKATENVKEDENPIGLKVWSMAWDTYMIFKEWYENREWYHFIGYLISVGGEYDAKYLLELFSDKNYLSKEQIRDEIVNKIISHTHMLKKGDGSYRTLDKDEYVRYISGLNYNKGPKMINDILLLFNVISVLSDSVNGEMSSRDTYFPFSRYKKENWNLEHIHSKADGASFTIDSANEFISYINEMLERMKKDKDRGSDRKILEEAIKNFNQKKLEQVNNGIDELEAIKFATQDSAQLIADKFDCDLDDAALNGLGNMALLDEKTNKSYQNAPFFMKRMIIGDIVRGKKVNVSRFIPFCTRNVFDKAYTRHPNNMLHWTTEDAAGYIDVIADTLCRYFCKKGEQQ